MIDNDAHAGTKDSWQDRRQVLGLRRENSLVIAAISPHARGSPPKRTAVGRTNPYHFRQFHYLVTAMSHFKLSSNSSRSNDTYRPDPVHEAGIAISPLRAIAMILAHGVLRLQQRQKQLDNPTEQSVHDHVLVSKGETL